MPIYVYNGRNRCQIGCILSIGTSLKIVWASEKLCCHSLTISTSDYFYVEVPFQKKNKNKYHFF